MVTANPGCIIQIAQGLAARGAPVEVLHIVDLLDGLRGAAGDATVGTQNPLSNGERAGGEAANAKQKVLELSALPKNRCVTVNFDKEVVVLFRRDDEILAIGDECPHQGGSLATAGSRATSSRARSTAGSSTCARAPA